MESGKFSYAARKGNQMCTWAVLLMVLEDIFTNELVSRCKSYVVMLTCRIPSCYSRGDRAELFCQGLRREEMGWYYVMGMRA